MADRYVLTYYSAGVWGTGYHRGPLPVANPHFFARATAELVQAEADRRNAAAKADVPDVDTLTLDLFPAAAGGPGGDL